MKNTRKLSIDQIKDQVAGKKIFLRADFNVPISNGQVTDPYRIEATIPTIDLLFKFGAHAVICASHCGRPNGQVVLKDSLRAIIPSLEKLSGLPVTFVPDCVGPATEKICENAPLMSLILLENLRFHAEEEGIRMIDGKKVACSEESVKEFRASLSRLGEIYVMDAFGTAHRAHSSIVGVACEFRVSGCLVAKELDHLCTKLEDPQRPVLGIVGGAKIADKILLLSNMSQKCDSMFIGGGMVFTLLKELKGMEIGSSLYDEAGGKLAKGISKEFEKNNCEMVLPVDFIIGSGFRKDAEVRTVGLKEGIPNGWMGLDIGPLTRKAIAETIGKAKTVFINGPPGVFEWEAFSEGSRAMCEALATKGDNKGEVIAAGGDTAAMLEKFGVKNLVSYVSTGGGATLELLEGKELPGIAALSSYID